MTTRHKLVVGLLIGVALGLMAQGWMPVGAVVYDGPCDDVPGAKGRSNAVQRVSSNPAAPQSEKGRRTAVEAAGRLCVPTDDDTGVVCPPGGVPCLPTTGPRSLSVVGLGLLLLVPAACRRRPTGVPPRAG